MIGTLLVVDDRVHPMPDRQQLALKIRSYLEALSPRAVSTLVRGLENARVRGSDDPHLDLILEACLGAVRDDGEREIEELAPREQLLERAFFRLLDDFLVNEALPTKVPGRITRSSLALVWTWIERDLAPKTIDAALHRLGAAENPTEDVFSIADDLRDAISPRMHQALEEIQGDDRAQQRLAMLVGGERAYRDLKDIIAVFEARGWLGALCESLPLRLTEWDLKSGSPSLGRIKAVADRHADHAFLIAAVVLARSDQPEALFALTSALSGADSVRKMATSPYACFAEMAVCEIERLSLLLGTLRSNADLSESLDTYIRIVKTIDRHYEIDEHPGWQGRIAETRRVISRLVTRELEAAAGNIRRALIVPKIGPDGEPQSDPMTLEEAQRGLILLDRMRDSADSLAVNEITTRTRQMLDQSLEIKTRALLGDLSKTKGVERTAHLIAVDAAIALCEGYFGSDYADQLRRSRKASLAVTPADEEDEPNMQRSAS